MITVSETTLTGINCGLGGVAPFKFTVNGSGEYIYFFVNEEGDISYHFGSLKNSKVYDGTPIEFDVCGGTDYTSPQASLKEHLIISSVIVEEYHYNWYKFTITYERQVLETVGWDRVNKYLTNTSNT